MANYIRACFCIDQYLDLSGLHKLLELLSHYDCYPIGSPRMNIDRWMDQKLEWNIQNEPQKARLFQLSSANDGLSLISFDIDEFLLLPERKISYEANQDPLFAVYKLIIIDLIKHLMPNIGMIDYDADLLCNEISTMSLAAWGNFFSYDYLNSWKPEERTLLTQLVDEFISIDEFGILTFIHPLMANQAWSERHEHLERLIRLRLP